MGGSLPPISTSSSLGSLPEQIGERMRNLCSRSIVGKNKSLRQGMVKPLHGCIDELLRPDSFKICTQRVTCYYALQWEKNVDKIA